VGSGEYLVAVVFTNSCVQSGLEHDSSAKFSPSKKKFRAIVREEASEPRWIGFYRISLCDDGN
jgi:hypothetical protein